MRRVALRYVLPQHPPVRIVGQLHGVQENDLEEEGREGGREGWVRE